MALSIAITKFLVQARQSGVLFDRILTLGRQNVSVAPQRIEAILNEYGFWPPSSGAAEFYRLMAEPANRFETLARALGAMRVEACDVSAYEGASLVHDLNQPIPAEWEDKFEVVLDGGTLEHVFNFPVAIANCMKLVKTGGHLILITPANNYCGHGFYQFSPELFYRVLSRQNGFQVERMIAVSDDFGISSLFGVKYPFPITGPEYAVQDPVDVQQRVTLMNSKSVLLFIQAKKISAEPLFQQSPQQSDYLGQWKTGADANPLGQTETGNRIITWLRSKLSETFCRETLPKLALLLDPFRLSRFRRQNSFHNKELYRLVKEDERK